jgi:ribosomal protein S18 acetylase RimI-like enzyme
MQIRTFAYPDDLSAVLHLWSTAGPGVHLGPSDEPAELQKKLMRDPDLFLVAEEGGSLIGAVMGGFDGRRAIVYHLAIEPSRRRQGLGSQLMAEMEARLRAKGCLKMYLLVTQDNPEALQFYQRLGWDVMDMHLMGKELG